MAAVLTEVRGLPGVVAATACAADERRAEAAPWPLPRLVDVELALLEPSDLVALTPASRQRHRAPSSRMPALLPPPSAGPSSGWSFWRWPWAGWPSWCWRLVVGLATRHSLEAQADTVDLLRSMGASDGYLGPAARAARPGQHLARRPDRAGAGAGPAPGLRLLDRLAPPEALPALTLTPLDVAQLTVVPAPAFSGRARRLPHRPLAPLPPRLSSCSTTGSGLLLPRTAAELRTPTLCPSLQIARAAAFNVVFYGWTTLLSLAVLPIAPFLSARGHARRRPVLGAGHPAGPAADRGPGYEVRGREHLPATPGHHREQASVRLGDPGLPRADPRRRHRPEAGLDPDPGLRLVPDEGRQHPHRPRRGRPRPALAGRGCAGARPARAATS